MASNHQSDMSFLSEMQDVKPLGQNDKVNLRQSASNKATLSQQLKREALQKQQALDDNGLSIEHVAPIDPHDFISYKQDGVQEGVFKNLRLGKYEIESRLNLRGMSFDDARLKIFSTITECHERGVRTILIDHGLGLQSKPFAGFLKSYVNQWLQEMQAVIAFHTALKHHGGLACVYVLLKKHANQKQINRELHQKRY